MKRNVDIMTIYIENVEIWNVDSEPTHNSLLLSNRQIHVGYNSEPNAEIIDGTGLIAMPGFIDIHIHGAMGGDVMDATDDAFQQMARALVEEGTTSFLATTMTQTDEAIERVLQNIAKFTSHPTQSQMIGIHLEGPFINSTRAGAQQQQYMRPANWLKFQEWQTLSQSKIKVVTIAPELITDDFIEQASKEGVIVSAGHTDATSKQIQNAQQKGLRSITHLYNQMSPFHHREIGVVGEALQNNHLYCEIIVDGVHCSADAVNFSYRNKGADRLILITDAMRAKGLPSGTYDLGGQMVYVKNEARLADGTLAGSILKMSDAVKNMQTFTECSPSDLVKMSSYNACQLLNIENCGMIIDGYKADIVLLNKQFEVMYTIINGEVVYRAV